MPVQCQPALLKAELLHARHRRHGLTWRERLFSSVDLLGQLGCLAPRLANRLLQSGPAAACWRKIFWHRGATPPAALRRGTVRPLVCASGPARSGGRRGRVFLWDDTFARYHEPHIGKAAVAVLEAAGFTVTLVAGRKCCGRPAFSQGCLDKAAALGRHNLAIVDTPGAAPSRSFFSNPPAIPCSPRIIGN